MALYLVVHHEKDAIQPWVNSWTSQDLLEAITTTRQIGRLCAHAQMNGEVVFVHRCSWSNNHPVICCTVEVDSVNALSTGSYVKFKNAILNSAAPPVQPTKGQNYYIH